jgi:hypothetical protein
MAYLRHDQNTFKLPRPLLVARKAGARDEMTYTVPLKWRLMRRIIRWTVSDAARRTLGHRTLTSIEGQAIRWLRPEIERFLEALEQEVEALHVGANLEILPTFGNRLMVELAVYTAAFDRALRGRGIAAASARQAMADMGWDVYRRGLLLISLPVRLITRDPGRRLRWTIRMLLRFPFNAPGLPGYAVKSWTDGEDILTHFTHCPPQSFVRHLSERARDPDVLEAFRNSWCLYDWPGADVIAGDRKRGHYRRSRTLSHGDLVCDMCWLAAASSDARHEARVVQPKDISEL